MTTIARPGDRVEITAVQSYEATWDDTLDRLIGLTGVLIAVNDSHLRENERTGTLDCAPFEVRIDRDAEIDAGQVVFAASVRPVGPEPSEAAGEERREQYAKAVLEVKNLAGLFADVRAHVDPVMAVADAEQAKLRARVAELEAERHSTNESLSEAAEQLRRDRDRIAALEVAQQPAEGSSYPPALPWARLMDDDDLIEFLTDLAAVMRDARHMTTSAGHVHAHRILDGVEKACSTWRLIAEAQHAHNTAPGPDTEDTEDDVAPQVRKLRALLAGQRKQQAGGAVEWCTGCNTDHNPDECGYRPGAGDAS